MKKKIMFLDYECKPGERVQYRDHTGKVYEGILRDWDKSTEEAAVATLILNDGTEKIIVC
jgi:hypothetical protein